MPTEPVSADRFWLGDHALPMWTATIVRVPTSVHRYTSVLHAAAMARDIADLGAIAVCALISPYRDARAAARELVGPQRFVEAFVDTPLHVCEARDPKGLYRRWRRGEVQNVTGLDDPYEPPLAPDVVLRTEQCSVADNVRRVMQFLIKRELIVSAASNV